MPDALTNPDFWLAIGKALAPFVLAIALAVGAWLKWGRRQVSTRDIDAVLERLAGRSPLRNTLEELDAARRTITDYMRDGKDVDDLVGFRAHANHPSGYIYIELITKSAVIAEAEHILHQRGAA